MVASINNWVLILRMIQKGFQKNIIYIAYVSTLFSSVYTYKLWSWILRFQTNLNPLWIRKRFHRCKRSIKVAIFFQSTFNTTTSLMYPTPARLEKDWMTGYNFYENKRKEICLLLQTCPEFSLLIVIFNFLLKFTLTSFDCSVPSQACNLLFRPWNGK